MSAEDVSADDVSADVELADVELADVYLSRCVSRYSRTKTLANTVFGLFIKLFCTF